MSRAYANFTDEQLQAEIDEYQAAKKAVLKGGIAVIAGEGRRIEYARPDMRAIGNELRALYAEANRRGIDAGRAGGAIKVEFD